jgi:hypothetical protein
MADAKERAPMAAAGSAPQGAFLPNSQLGMLFVGTSQGFLPLQSAGLISVAPTPSPGLALNPHQPQSIPLGNQGCFPLGNPDWGVGGVTGKRRLEDDPADVMAAAKREFAELGIHCLAPPTCLGEWQGDIDLDIESDGTFSDMDVEVAHSSALSPNALPQVRQDVLDIPQLPLPTLQPPIPTPFPVSTPLPVPRRPVKRAKTDVVSALAAVLTHALKGVVPTTSVVRKPVKDWVSKPSKWNNERKDGSVKTWLASVEHYMDLCDVPMELRVGTAVTFLGQDVQKWWYGAKAALVATGMDVSLWQTFVHVLRWQYGSMDEETQARKSLDSLTLAKCNGEMDTYVRRSHVLHSEISRLPLSEGEKIHRFLAGCPSDLRQLLRLDRDNQEWAEFAQLARFACSKVRDRVPVAGNMVLSLPGSQKGRQARNKNGKGSQKKQQAAKGPSRQGPKDPTKCEDRKLGRCFKCHQTGHLARDCPAA